MPGLNIFSLAWLLLTLISISVKAQSDDYWTPSTDIYDNYMTITSCFYLNGRELSSDQFEIGCFIEGECRGSYKLQEMPYLGHPFPGFLSIWGCSSDNGKAITVQIYDRQRGKVYQANETPQFRYNESIGIDMPFEFTITVPDLFNIQMDSSEGGIVTVDPWISTGGKTITLTLTPNNGYQIDTVCVFKSGDETTSVTTEGVGNTRIFIMPDFDVTVSAIFKTPDVKTVSVAFNENEFLQITNIGHCETEALYFTLSGNYAEKFSLLPAYLDNLSIGCNMKIQVVPNEGLASGDYTLMLTVESDRMTPISLIFTYQIIKTSVSLCYSGQNKVWASNGGLDILAAINGKAYVYNLQGKLVEVVCCNPTEQKRVWLKQGVYIVVLGGVSYKVLVN